MIMLMIMLGQDDWDLFVETSARNERARKEHMSLVYVLNRFNTVVR